MNRLPFSLRRTGLIAHHTLREAARQRLAQFLVVLAAALVVGALGLRDLNFGSSELKFLADFGFGALAWFGSVLSITLTAQIFFNEIEHRTVLTLLAKPVWRAEFILGKYLGVVAVISMFCGMMTMLVTGILAARELSLLRGLPDVAGGGHRLTVMVLVMMGFGQGLKFAVLAAFTLLIASFAQTQIFAMGCGFLFLVIGHLQFFVQASAARAESAALRVGARLLAGALPDFQAFDFAALPTRGDPAGWGHLGQVTVYTAAYVAIVSALTVFSFQRREI